MEENVPLSKYTTFKIGGSARYFFRIRKVEDIISTIDFARKENLPIFVLGGGSNLLVNDDGFRGVIAKNEILGLSYVDVLGGVEVASGSGELWDEFVDAMVNRNLYGLENLSGIPGTVGASPVQNIGAYGVEVKDFVIAVETIDMRSGAARIFSNSECHFGYRDSFFKTPEGKNFFIIKVTFLLKNSSPLNLEYKDLKNYFSLESRKNIVPTLQLVRSVVLEIRKGKFPDLKNVGTAGSFFKNPIISKEKFEDLRRKFPNLPGFKIPSTSGQDLMIKIPLAWILDNVCHLKGYVKEGVGLFELQPIVLVSADGTSSSQVRSLAVEVSRCVKEKVGIEIEWEVNYLS
ncbi:MAG: UDP-N-acetylmuramate dehydrogenase [Candidatus Taylorbacteria bacterium]|nr:UDP-N-acetylmuramate dehydrogenase [Candidatus Taylorbacteria bacterium]